MKRSKLSGIAIAIAALLATAAFASPADAAGGRRHGGQQVQVHRGYAPANRGHFRRHRAPRWGHYRQYRPRHRARNHDFGYNAAPLAIFLGALLVLNAQNH